MKFITYHVELTDEALGVSWTVDHTYHYSHRDFFQDKLPDLEKKFAKEVMWAFAYHVGFFGRTITVSAVTMRYEDRQPTLDEAKKIRGWDMIRLVAKDGEGTGNEPTPLYKTTFVAQGELES